MTSLGFDVGNTKPQAAFDPLPPGWYAMMINKVDLVDGKNPAAGKMLKIEFEVMDEHAGFAGRKVFTNFCHQHENKQTKDIARAQIAAIAHAIGRPNAATTDEFLGCELRVKLSVKPASGQYEAGNDCKGFKGLKEAVDAPPAAGAPATGAGGAPAKSQPWKK